MLFRFAGLPLLNHPAVFACLAMVVGLYEGLTLGISGSRREIFDPIGLSSFRALWPIRTIVLCLTNDRIWWVPFALYFRAGFLFKGTTSPN